jgi:hypothetical protein
MPNAWPKAQLDAQLVTPLKTFAQKMRSITQTLAKAKAERLGESCRTG